MASQLVSALLGGDPATLGALGGMDPAALTAMPEIQIGQALMKQGLDTSPAHPMQALARVLQAAAGQSVQQSAVSDLAKAYAGTADNLSKAFPPDHPIQKFLKSPDPVTRATGIQSAQKLLVLASEPQKLNPGETVGVPTAPSTTVVNTGPQSPEGKLARDARQGGIPTTVAPTSLPLPPPRLGPASAGPPAPGGGVPGAPAGPVVPPAPAPGLSQGAFDSRFTGAPSGAALRPGGDILETAARAKGLQTQAESEAKNAAEYGDLLKPQAPPQPGPGGTEPLRTPRGTIVPPVTEQAALPKSPKELDQAIATWQKTKTDWQSGLVQGQLAEERLQTIAGAFKAIETGSFTTQKAQVAAALKAVGINLPASTLTDPSKVQLALHENYVETLQQLKAATPRFTQMEFKALSQNKEHPDLQPEANLQMLAEDIGTIRQARDLPTDFAAAQRHGWKDPQSFEQAWLRANPVTRYVDQAKGEIGPLKGMAGNGGAVPAGPAVGTVAHGYRFKGGDPNSQASWEPVK